jgi:hypothetical protein
MMSTITPDATIQQWLGQLTDVTEIRDSNGKLLGVFTPRLVAEERDLYEKAHKLFVLENTERVLRQEKGQGVPLEEVWKELAPQRPE